MGASSEINTSTTNTDSNINIYTTGLSSDIDVSTTNTDSNINTYTTGEGSSIITRTTGLDSDILTYTSEPGSSIIAYTEGDSSEMRTYTKGQDSNIHIFTNGISARINISTTGQDSNINTYTTSTNSGIYTFTTKNSSEINTYTTGLDSDIYTTTTYGSINSEAENSGAIRHTTSFGNIELYSSHGDIHLETTFDNGQISMVAGICPVLINKGLTYNGNLLEVGNSNLTEGTALSVGVCTTGISAAAMDVLGLAVFDRGIVQGIDYLESSGDVQLSASEILYGTHGAYSANSISFPPVSDVIDLLEYSGVCMIQYVLPDTILHSNNPFNVSVYPDDGTVVVIGANTVVTNKVCSVPALHPVVAKYVVTPGSSARLYIIGS